MKLLKYGIVGVVAFAVDFSLLWILAPQVHIVIANTAAFAVANCTNFVLAHKWVFGRALEAKAFRTHYPAVFAISVVGLILNDSVVWMLFEIFDTSLVVSKVTATVAAMIWNYFARTRWAYPESLHS